MQRPLATLHPLRHRGFSTISSRVTDGERSRDVGAVVDSQPARRRVAVTAKRMRRMGYSWKKVR
jgi:hypothetical protein